MTLRRIFDTILDTLLKATPEASTRPADASADVQRQIDTTNRQIAALIEELSLSDTIVREAIRTRLAGLNQHAARLKGSLLDVQVAQEGSKQARAALERMAPLLHSKERRRFWERSDADIHRDLRIILDGRWVLIKDGKFAGLTERHHKPGGFMA